MLNLQVFTAGLVIVEHFKNARPSQPAALYLAVSSLLVACRLRTLCLVSTGQGVIVALGLSLAARLALFLSLQISARRSLINGSDLAPERTAGLAARYFVWWVVPLLWRGYKKPLGAEDLGAIDENLHSPVAFGAFAPSWIKQSIRHARNKTRQPLLWASVSAFRLTMIAPLFPYLISSVVTMARPLIIGQTVSFVESYQTDRPQPLYDGWGLVGATALTYLTYSFSRAVAEVATQRCALMLRGAFTEALYRKSLGIKTETARQMGAAKASNLMSVDINSIVMNVKSCHDVWTALVTTALGMYIIWTRIGISFVSGRCIHGSDHQLASVGGAILFFGLLPIFTRNLGQTRSEQAWKTHL
jgi:ATP-binding cassette subfamily C (CFTR/MRP) protein 1